MIIHKSSTKKDRVDSRVGGGHGLAGATRSWGSSFALRFIHVIASGAKQSISPRKGRMDCFVAHAPRNDERKKMAGISPGHFHGAITLPRRRDAGRGRRQRCRSTLKQRHDVLNGDSAVGATPSRSLIPSVF